MIKETLQQQPWQAVAQRLSSIEVLLVIAAIAVAIYNFGLERQIAYLASIVAVCGTVAILVKDIYKAKKK